jgi:hypothetical protein
MALSRFACLWVGFWLTLINGKRQSSGDSLRALNWFKNAPNDWV